MRSFPFGNTTKVPDETADPATMSRSVFLRLPRTMTAIDCHGLPRALEVAIDPAEKNLREVADALPCGARESTSARFFLL